MFDACCFNFDMGIRIYCVWFRLLSCLLLKLVERQYGACWTFYQLLLFNIMQYFYYVVFIFFMIGPTCQHYEKLLANLNSIRVLTDRPKILKITIKTFRAPIETYAPFNWFSYPEESRYLSERNIFALQLRQLFNFFDNFDTFFNTGCAKSSNSKI